MSYTGLEDVTETYTPTNWGRWRTVPTGGRDQDRMKRKKRLRIGSLTRRSSGLNRRPNLRNRIKGIVRHLEIVLREYCFR